jgi:hypothetical protein
LPSGCARRVVVAPGQRRDLAEPHRAQEHQRREHAPIVRRRLGRDDGLHLVAREHRGAAPRAILVALRRKLVLEHARARRDQLVGDGIVEHRAQRAVDVPDRPRREELIGWDERAILAPVALPLLLRQRVDELSYLPRA